MSTCGNTSPDDGYGNDLTVNEILIADQLERVLYHVEKRVYARHGQDSEVEDLVQEARIHAWQDIRDGLTDISLIIRRAANRASNLSSERGAPRGAPTGHQMQRQQHARAQGDVTRRKIIEFVATCDEPPSNRQVARALDLSDATVSRQMARLYLFAPEQPGSIVVGPLPEADSAIPAAGHGRFEADSIRRLSVASFVQRCPADERQVLFRRFWQDQTLGVISREMGVNSSRLVSQAVDRVRVLMQYESDLVSAQSH